MYYMLLILIILIGLVWYYSPHITEFFKNNVSLQNTNQYMTSQQSLPLHPSLPLAKTNIKKDTNVKTMKKEYITIELLATLPKDKQDEIFKLYELSFDDTNQYDNFSKDTTLFLYVIDDRIIGMVGCLTTEQLLQYLSDNGINEAEEYGVCKPWNGIFIYNVCVHPDFRKKGIACQMMATVDAWIQDQNAANPLPQHIDYTHLIVKGENIPAQNLYNKLGFEIDRESKDESGAVYVMKKTYSRPFTLPTYN